MSTPEKAVCIDPLADLDWDAVRHLLTQTRPTKIFHAARQDLEVLHNYLSVMPANVFDTQIASAFCGYGEQVGYAHLVKEICGVSLPKAFTRTPWCRRPLSEEEIQYALDDVHYLGMLYETLSADLHDRGRVSWQSDDCAALVSDQVLQKAQHEYCLSSTQDSQSEAYLSIQLKLLTRLLLNQLSATDANKMLTVVSKKAS